MFQTIKLLRVQIHDLNSQTCHKPLEASKSCLDFTTKQLYLCLTCFHKQDCAISYEILCDGIGRIYWKLAVCMCIYASIKGKAELTILKVGQRLDVEMPPKKCIFKGIGES